jgi:hypothetical protein
VTFVSLAGTNNLLLDPVMGTESRNGCEGCDAAKVGQGHVPNDIYQQARGSFSENELVNLTLAIIVINGWNRLAISLRTLPEI